MSYTTKIDTEQSVLSSLSCSGEKLASRPQKIVPSDLLYETDPASFSISASDPKNPVLPHPKKGPSFIEDVFDIQLQLLRTTLSTAELQSTQTKEAQKVCTMMSTLSVLQATDAMEKGTRMLDMMQTVKKEQDEYAGLESTVSTINWVMLGLTLFVTAGTGIVNFLGTKAATAAAETAGAAAVEDAAIVTESAAAEAESIGDSVAAQGSRVESASVQQEAATVSQQTATPPVETPEKMDWPAWENPKNPGKIDWPWENPKSGYYTWAKNRWPDLPTISPAVKSLSFQGFALVSTFVATYPSVYQYQMKQKMSETLTTLAKCQQESGLQRATAETSSQHVSFWQHCSERSTLAAEDIIDSTKDTIEMTGNFLKANKQIASLIRQGQRA